jgi:hypothetical protein
VHSRILNNQRGAIVMQFRGNSHDVSALKCKHENAEPIGVITERWWWATKLWLTTNNIPSIMKIIRTRAVGMEEYGGWNLPEFIRAARELEEEGVAAITTNCGLTAIIQEELANAVDILAFTSSLLQVPLIHRMLKKGKKIGILTWDKQRCVESNYRLLRYAGIDESIPIAIEGMQDSEEFAKVINNGGYGDYKKCKNELVAKAKLLVSKNPNIGAIVLECTEMPIFGLAIHEATGLPVFDHHTLVWWIYNSIVKKKYYLSSCKLLREMIKNTEYDFNQEKVL